MQGVLDPLFEEDIESNGDLYLDLAETYMDTGNFKHALVLLKKLVYTKNYNLVSLSFISIKGTKMPLIQFLGFTFLCDEQDEQRL